MHKARLNDARPLGLLIQQAIHSSIKLVMVIGGLVVFFSVLLAYLSLGPLMDMLTAILRSILQFIHIPPALSTSLINGLLEVTLGTKSAGQATTTIPLVYKVAAASFILSWGGLSVHAQVVSILHLTNLRYATFALARLIHGILAACFVFLIWNPLQPIGQAATPVLTNLQHKIWSPWGGNAWLLSIVILLGVIVLFHIIDYDDRRTH
jgi:nucleoside recognition membrane protein YjiH